MYGCSLYKNQCLFFRVVKRAGWCCGRCKFILEKYVILYMIHRWSLFSSEKSAYLHVKGRVEEYWQLFICILCLLLSFFCLCDSSYFLKIFFYLATDCVLIMPAFCSIIIHFLNASLMSIVSHFIISSLSTISCLPFFTVL